MESEETAVGAGSIVRLNLQQRLLDAVKQCQIHFGARQEMATETDLRVGTLCMEWEAVLVHGMRRSKNKPPLKQFAALKVEVSLWPLAQLCLSAEEVQRFLRLASVHNDIGRGRAWLRAAINERTLETYLQLILSSGKLRSLYESHGFLLDQERSSMLPVMAAGLSSILFSIPVDADYLNTPARNLDLSIMAMPLSTGSTPSSALLDMRSTQNGHPEEESVVMVNKKKKRKKPLLHGRQSPVGGRLGEWERGGEGVAKVGVASLQEGVAHHESSENLSSSPSVASLNSDLETTPRFVALDMVLLGNQSSSEAEAEAAMSATAAVLTATHSSSSSPALHRPHPPGSGPPAPQQGNHVQQGGHTLSPDELRDALLAMVRTKDELEEANKRLNDQLQEVRCERDKLRIELSSAQAELTSLHCKHIQQQALERENDLLKEQLKLMVQRRDSTLRLGDSSFEGSAGGSYPSSEATPTNPHPPSSPENKLSEMADMHGELLELNDRLQRDMTHKDNYITRLINSIQEAGLQVPTPTVPPATSTAEATGNTSSGNEFVSVWIPSVIKRGRGPDAHHIYQVFIRIRDQEWNVYRRYAEFREFHKQLQQCIPEVASFHFPPKKALGNKSAQLVEERRFRLQDYLRVVVRLCTEPRTVQGKRRRHQLEPIMKRDIDRDTLQDILPFFREDMHSSNPALSESHRLSYSGL